MKCVSVYVCVGMCVPGKNIIKPSYSEMCVLECVCVCVYIHVYMCVCVYEGERVYELVSEKAVCGEWVTVVWEGGKPATCSHDRL